MSLMAASCSDNEDENKVTFDQDVIVTVTSKKFEIDEMATRASLYTKNNGVADFLFGWGNDDIVVYEVNNTDPKDSIHMKTLPSKEPSSTSGIQMKTTITGSTKEMKEGNYYTAYYNPRESKGNYTYQTIPIDYTGQNQSELFTTADTTTIIPMGQLNKYDYMYCTQAQVKSLHINFDFKHLGAIVELWLHFPYLGDYTKLKGVYITSNEPNDDETGYEKPFLTKGYFNSNNGQIYTTEAKRTVSISTLKDGKPLEVKSAGDYLFYMMLAPVQLTKNVTITLQATNGTEDKYYTSSFAPIQNIRGGYTYRWRNAGVNEYIQLEAVEIQDFTPGETITNTNGKGTETW